MKKHILLAAFAVVTTTFVSAQVSTTPEVPRNYKPKPKELLPMPDSLTTAKIFPVLGKYHVANNNGDSTTVYVTLDPENKGVVWVNGFSQGKFKADLQASPSVYKIPAQKTFINDAEPKETPGDAAVDDSDKKASKALSGKSVDGGTLIFDEATNALYINLGDKFNEEYPASVFPELNAADATTDASASEKKSNKTVKGINYTGSKVVDVSVTENSL